MRNRDFFEQKFKETIKLKNRAIDREEAGDSVHAVKLYKEIVVHCNVLLNHTDEINDKYELNYLLGAIYRRLGLLDESLTCALEANKIKPSSDSAVNSLYLTYVDRGETRNALDTLVKFSNNNRLDSLVPIVSEIISDYNAGMLQSFEKQIRKLAKRAELRV